MPTRTGIGNRESGIATALAASRPGSGSPFPSGSGSRCLLENRVILPPPARDEPGVDDQPLELPDRGAMRRICGRHDVLVDYERAEVIAAEGGGVLADFHGDGHTARVEIGAAVEQNARDRACAQ